MEPKPDSVSGPSVRYARLASDRAELARRLSQQAGVASSVPQENKPASLPPRDTVPTTRPSVPLLEKADADVETNVTYPGETNAEGLYNRDFTDSGIRTMWVQLKLLF